MNPAAEAALERWKRDGRLEDRDACMDLWLPVVKRVYSRVKISLPPQADSLADDLLQCGLVGLWQALDSWSPERKVPFSAWAQIRVRGAMLDELRRVDLLSKESRRRWKEMQAAMGRVQQRLQRPCTEEEWARELNVSLQQLREEILENSLNTVFFKDELPGEFGMSQEPSPAAEAERRELRGRLERAIGQLPSQEYRLLALVLGEGLGHGEAAEVLGVSPGRVSQIYGKAVLHLQTALAEKSAV